MTDTSLRDEIRAHYEQASDEDARLRTGLGRLELWRVQEIVRQRLGAGRARVLDVGGATGVHAEWLLDDGHEVRLVDLLDHHVARATELLGHRGGFSAVVGDARSLPVADSSADVVLLLGPLYHLHERADRVAAWREAARTVVPGGVVVGMGISRFASLFDGLAQGYLFDEEFRRVVEADLATGEHVNPEDRPGWFTTAYFGRPDELADEATDAGLVVEQVLGVEGIAGWHTHLGPRLDSPADRQVVLDAMRAVQDEPSVVGVSPHVVAVAHRPQ